MQSRAGLALALAVALSGCADAQEPNPPTDTDPPPSPDPNKCTSETPAYSWSWDTMNGSLGDTGSEGFDLPNGTVKVVITGHNGPHVEGRWTFEILDENRTQRWEYLMTAPSTAVGEDNNVPDESVALGPGPYIFGWDLEAVAMSEFTMDVTALHC